MTASTQSTLGDELLLKEYDHASEHYRHLENLRAQHLGFLFTVSFAAVAYVGSFHHALVRPWQAVAVASIAFLVTILACFTYINVRKFGIALTHNRDIIHGIRAKAMVDIAQISQILKDPHAPARTQPSSRFLRSRLFTVQGTAELTCLIAGSIAASANVGLAIYFVGSGGSLEARILLVALACASSGLVISVVSVGDRPYWVGR